MATHLSDRIPSAEYINQWFLFNARTSPYSTLTPELVVKILNKGYTRIYVSMGARFAEQQAELQKQDTFQNSLSLLQGLSFDMVVIDCLNPPFQEITQVLPCFNNMYLLGEVVSPFFKQAYNSWKGKCYIPRTINKDSNTFKSFSEFYNGPYTGYTKFLELANECWKNTL
jgi:hypothetical protein